MAMSWADLFFFRSNERPINTEGWGGPVGCTCFMCHQMEWQTRVVKTIDWLPTILGIHVLVSAIPSPCGRLNNCLIDQAYIAWITSTRGEYHSEELGNQILSALFLQAWWQAINCISDLISNWVFYRVIAPNLWRNLFCWVCFASFLMELSFGHMWLSNDQAYYSLIHFIKRCVSMLTDSWLSFSSGLMTDL